MARRRGGKTRTVTRQRDTTFIANRVRLPVVNLLRPLRYSLPRVATVVEDRRRYHPHGRFARPRVFTGVESTTIAPRTRRDGRRERLMSQLAFDTPKRVLACQRRSERREVLHALGKTGRGSTSRRRKRLTEFSKLRC